MCFDFVELAWRPPATSWKNLRRPCPQQVTFDDRSGLLLVSVEASVPHDVEGVIATNGVGLLVATKD